MIRFSFFVDHGMYSTSAHHTRQEVLIVDLDGTLLKTDSLVELFWLTFRKSPAMAWKALRLLVSEGRLQFKDYLARVSEPKIADWPWNEAVVNRARKAREAGVKTVLLTASDQRLAELVQAEMGLFDEVVGSDGSVNLKGPMKAQWILDRYAGWHVTYIGNSSIDAPVWEISDHAVGVGINPRTVSSVRGSTEFLPSGSNYSVSGLFYAMRPHQWLKNSLLILPLLLAQVSDVGAYLEAIIGFVIFSMIASGVYLLNDLLDVDRDRAHPRKRFRPIASGDLSIPGAIVASLVCGVFGLIAAASLDVGFAMCVAIYVALTSAYSFGVKQYPWVDIVLLASLYTWRIVSGAVLVDLPISGWLVMFSLVFFLGLAALKRYAELIDRALIGSTTNYGRGYEVADQPRLRAVTLIAMASAIVIFVVYLQAMSTLVLYPDVGWLFFVVVALALWLYRMWRVTIDGSMHDDPLVFAARDPLSWALGFIVVACMGIAGAWS